MGGTVNVTAVAPDTIDLAGPEEPPRLNLFLLSGDAEPGLAQPRPAVAVPDSGERLTNPPLALDLHYLLTAYGARRLPGRDPARLWHASAARAPGARPRRDPPRARPQPARRRDAAARVPGARRRRPRRSGRADQDHAGRDGREEMSRLWSAIQSHYRPTAAYRGLGGADRGDASPQHAAAGAVARADRSRDASATAASSSSPTCCRRCRRCLRRRRRPAGRRAARRAVVLSGIRLSGSNFHVRLAHPLFPAPLNWCRAHPTTTAPNSP